MTVYEYTIIKDDQKGYGLVRITEKRRIAKPIKWFETYMEAENAEIKITGKVRTIVL